MTITLLEQVFDQMSLIDFCYYQRRSQGPKGLGAKLRLPEGASVEVVQSQLPTLDPQPQYTIKNMSQVINILNQG
jgi:hypothetical protein